MPAVLRNRNYRIWLTGLSLANVGTWMQRIAQDWLVLQLTGRSGTALGIVTACQFLPILAIGPFGGVLADRFDKRHTLLWTQVAVGACGVVLGILALTRTVALWHVLALAVLLGIANAVFQPTVQAFVLELVTRDEVTRVVGISGGSFHAARLIGPAAAGVLIAAAGGTGPAFLVAATTVVGPIVALLRMDPAKLHRLPRTGAGPGMFVEGVRYAWRDPRIRFLLGVTAFVSTFVANSAITNALMATTVYHKGAREFGLLGSIMAIGSLAGALLAARRRSVTVRFAVGAALAFGGFTLLSSAMPGYPAFAVALIPVALAQLTFITAANSALQLSADPALRGRVMALFMVLMTGTTPLAAPVIGWLAQHAGARLALAASSAAGIAGVLVCVAIGRGNGGDDVRHRGRRAGRGDARLAAGPVRGTGPGAGEASGLPARLPR
jgi:MFS family permease